MDTIAHYYVDSTEKSLPQTSIMLYDIVRINLVEINGRCIWPKNGLDCSGEEKFRKLLIKVQVRLESKIGLVYCDISTAAVDKAMVRHGIEHRTRRPD
jgi:hypothetical protein